MSFKTIKYSLFIVILTTFFAIPLLSQDNDIHDLLFQRDFNDGVVLPWDLYSSNEQYANMEALNGECVIHVNDGGENRWDIQLRHRDLIIEEGHTYTIKFKVVATADTDIYVKVGTAGPPYNEYWNNGWSPISLTAGQEVLIEDTFTMADPTDKGCEFAIHMGGDLTGPNVPFDIRFDDIHLEDPEFERQIVVELPKPDVRVNQVGYFPDAKKIATIVSASTTPIDWYLKNADGVTVMSGTTTVYGDDVASGDHVHNADFSEYSTEGTGYTLCIDGDDADIAESHPFDIGTDIYSQMKYDALAYFYQNRSGITIEEQYVAHPDLARPAGHISDIMPTWPDSTQDAYSLDVSKGWYDAGDHGKYVVNGGISLWTVQNQYERALVLAKADKTILADGSLNIPEQGNGYPDILDEARWEMECLLGFQVPDEYEFAGMVHHKGHDEGWTGIPLLPSDDIQPRYLAPPTTAATLNLAATAAQSSRLWKDLDPAFSERCLVAAEKAWIAALENPSKDNSLFDDAKGNVGGGKYGDPDVEDDFYWAACELYVTTGSDEYKTFIENSPYYLQQPSQFITGADPGMTGAFTWGDTLGLGTLTLALVPNGLDAADVQAARSNMVQAADDWIAIMEAEGYVVPINEGPEGYVWGSNSFIVNQMIVMALAYDFTGDWKYVDGVTQSMDYILGRNAMDKSYVSGYGERPLENPHHRFWAYQMNKSWPKPPAGCFSGGPNKKLEDPYVQGIGLPGSPSAKCYVDNIESWSTNEITINWNAPFAWVVGWLDETRETEPLGITLTAPANGAKLRSGDITVAASATGDVSSVYFFVNNVFIGQDNSAPYEYVWMYAMPGDYSVTALVVGTDGSYIWSEAADVEVADNFIPEVSLISPADGAVFEAEDSIVISAAPQDYDGQIDYVDFLLDGQHLYTATVYPYSYDAGTLPPGKTYTITAVAVDNDGANSIPAKAVITVKSEKKYPPEVTLLAPVDGDIFDENETISMSAAASDIDGQVILVEFFADGVKVGESTGPVYIHGGYDFNWTTAAPGLYDITAKAIDNDGLFTITAPVSIEVKQEVTGIPLPGKIEVEDYTAAYDTTAGNEGGAYRNDDVDIEVCSEGGYNVGWIDAGEWLEFDVTVTETADYSISIRTAREEAGSGAIHVELGGADISGTISVPSTGNWQTFTTTTKKGISLAKGSYVLKVAMDEGPFNLNYVEFKKTGDEIAVEAEQYSSMSGVQLENCSEGGQNVGYIDAGDWMEYSVNASKGGSYKVSYRVAGWENSAALETRVNGAAGARVSIPNTGEYQAWTTVDGGLLELNAGSNTIRINAAGSSWNINYFVLELTVPDTKPSVRIISPSAGQNFEVGETVTITASATDSNGTVEKVDFYNNGLFLGSDLQEPFQYTISGAVKGNYSITAVGTDNDGETGTSVAVDFTVGETGPVKKWEHTVTRHGQLSPEGKGTKDMYGNMVSFGGNSFFWSHDYYDFWNPELMEWLVTEWRTQIVRLPMAIAPNFHNDQKAWYKDREFALNQMCTMVDKAIELDIYVVIDFHSHHAENIVDHAKDFFGVLAEKYGKYDNVMFEIYNEPLDTTSVDAVVGYANQIIPVIREHSDNIIIVGSPRWSSRPSWMPWINGENIMYTYHYYASMGHWSEHGGELDSGKPIMITECGNDNGDMWNFVNRAKANHQSMMSWSVCSKQTSSDGNDSDWSIFQGHITGREGSWSDNDLSQAGRNQKDIIYGWGNYQPPKPISN